MVEDIKYQGFHMGHDGWQNSFAGDPPPPKAACRPQEAWRGAHRAAKGGAPRDSKRSCEGEDCLVLNVSQQRRDGGSETSWCAAPVAVFYRVGSRPIMDVHLARNRRRGGGEHQSSPERLRLTAPRRGVGLGLCALRAPSECSTSAARSGCTTQRSLGDPNLVTI